MTKLHAPPEPRVGAELSYDVRLKHLRAKKEAQTQEKLRKLGYMNEDDYGLVLPPEGFSWQPAPNHANGSFYGLDGWSRNFRSLLDCYPVYVDPMDALAEKYLAIGCSVMSPNTRRMEALKYLADRYRIDGVVEILLTACHTYAVEAYGVRNLVQSLGKKYLLVETDYSESDREQLSTRMDAFVEML